MPPGSTVVVVGDSISARSADQIKAAFAAAGLKATVIADPGLTLQESTSNIAKAAALNPTAIVFELGTNDVSSTVKREAGYTEAAFSTGLAEATGRFPNSCVVVTTVSANYTPAAKGTGTAAVNRVATQINGTIRSTSPHVADWDNEVRANPSIVIEDQTHPTDAGKVALADLMVGAVRSC